MDHKKHKVVIHLYDLSNGMAKAFSPMLIGKLIEGIWHTGIVVYDKEYYFGGGICAGGPKQTPYGYPVQEIDYGVTEVTQDIFESFLNDISSKYRMETYDLFTNNCNNFTNECSEFLVGQPIPAHITGLPQEFLNTQIGQMIKPIIEQMTNKAVADQSSQHFGQAPIANSQNSNQNADLQQQYVNQIANALSANFNNLSLGPQQPQQAPQFPSVPVVASSQGSQQASNVVPIEELEIFICCTSTSPKCVIDFYADWCGPCKQIKPTFIELSNQYPDISFFQINIDQAKEIAQQLDVKSIPTFMIYKDGEMKEKWTGGNPATLKQKVEQLKNQ